MGSLPTISQKRFYEFEIYSEVWVTERKRNWHLPRTHLSCQLPNTITGNEAHANIATNANAVTHMTLAHLQIRR